MFRNALEPWHLVLLVLVIVLVFGSKKLPDMARSLGKSARILKSEAKAMKDDGGKQNATPAQSAEEPTPAQRTIQAAPGDVTSSRPVNEPTDSTQR
ncbi:Sec-independent protein translocase subunit TatA [Streptomyces griseofuscus]|uniref:Sec-independent protein translocase protein TatA n=1 Tax=Streptomyces griseofuscus TaxID=146922 RepID=A0A3R8QBQ1_9ACTN|nr:MULTISPECIES: Sec-independent protein translocase subunit TatA [Streptomyces]BBC97011.1 twin-arginine translocase TatA/TatE family subunit [Streptomyces rochei]MBA9044887.1 sec-independent protein translocase protein TatA [Streptomyces murinus]MBJ7000207.1 Sec-independent protein translocase subunit TatA [Streptomyces sp. CRPSP2-6A1]MYQ89895.1 twin-arginine translocase TatA/TatE family subunit [Streptomyces sp. SID4946]MYR89522.1 twin-arginine translocase TatA/TatE family subunit [Streptomy